MTNGNRVVHVDIAKGISIILVALSHSDLSYFAHDVTKAMGIFRAPLFFFLSGLFFRPSLGIKAFLWKKSDELLKPYFSTLAALLFFSFIANREDNVIGSLAGILYGNGDTIRWVPMWFLPHLFAVFCFTYFVFRFSGIQKRHLVVKCITIAAMLAIGANWLDAFWRVEITLFGRNIELPGLPFSFDVIFISAPFFFAGTFFKEWIVNFIPNSYVFLVSIFVFFAIVMLAGAQVDINMRIYNNSLFATIGAICGIYFVLCISVYVSKLALLRNALMQYGQASLFILIFHVNIGSWVYKILGHFWMGVPADFINSLIAFFLSITFPILIKIIVSRSEVLSLFYLPLKSNNLFYRIRRVTFP